MRISDWSSDVCSSDLQTKANPPRVTTIRISRCHARRHGMCAAFNGELPMLQPNKRRAMIRFDRKRHTSAIAALLPLPLLFSVPAIAQQLDAAAAAEAPAPSSAAKPAADSDDSKIAEIGRAHV